MQSLQSYADSHWVIVAIDVAVLQIKEPDCRNSDHSMRATWMMKPRQACQASLVGEVTGLKTIRILAHDESTRSTSTSTSVSSATHTAVCSTRTQGYIVW